LREQYSLKFLLRIAGISKSSFFYTYHHLGYKEAKDKAIKEIVQLIFDKNYQKYGYPRITIKLRKLGYHVNHKKVFRIMKVMNLHAMPKRRMYKSYRGTVGKIADNILNQSFNTTHPYEKLGTDITQFRTPFGKLYLSPVIDFHTREILAYDLAAHPNMMQIKRMLDQLIKDHGPYLKNAVIQSDQGYQYQAKFYQQYLSNQGIIQSMSNKGNTLDNAPTENFFGRLKTEIYYDREYAFKSMQEVKATIHAYIRYYNEERIVNRLRTNPSAYRRQQLESKE
jgi:putative transposase